MRALLSVNKADFQAGSGPSWKSWLVKLGSPHAEVVFGTPDSKLNFHTVERQQGLSGLCLMGQRREASIKLRTLDSFKAHWNSMTAGVLDGLDWRNVLVAGGMIMGVLTGSFDAKGVESYKDSDIE